MKQCILLYLINVFIIMFFYSHVGFEKAYCEYRLNRTQDALNTLRGISEQDTRTKELLAQVVSRNSLFLSFN